MEEKDEEVTHDQERQQEEKPLNAGLSPKAKWPDLKAHAIRFPIVGIGCSAGGIDALEKIFMNMLSDTGISFVVITHFDPTRKAMLPEVVQRFTKMRVVEIADGVRLEPNTVYVIPANKDVSLSQGSFHLLEQLEERGLRMPIDHFFESMAKDQHNNAFSIILSGMGADGSTGLKMIMENFGMVMVQNPETAQFDSMPKNAIDTEYVDYILPLEEMPGHLLSYINHPLLKKLREINAKIKPAHALDKVYSLFRTQTGHDFSLYKCNTVYRRIERRMQSHNIAEFT